MTHLPLSRRWWTLVTAVMAAIFTLDHRTGAAPVQHLYYLPIVFAAISLERWAGLIAAVAAVVLYHLANPVVLTSSYLEADMVQVALFLVCGLAGSRLARDSRRLRRLSETDDLTGLYNLRGFEVRLSTLIHDARTSGRPLSLMVLDVDRLKSLNDTHGHSVGADAVRLVGQVLGSRLRDGAIACRFGGDEFVAALPGCGPEEALSIANDLRSAIHAHEPVLAGINFPAETISISAGLAVLSSAGGQAAASLTRDVADELFRVADRALYVAKEGGRNRISVTITA
jgi:diguanylate cyclase (GGDEF)-like protein